MLQKIWRASRFFVVLYSAVLLASMFLRQISWEVPLETLAMYWPILITAYTGFDRVVDAINTKNCVSGQVKLGDLAKLRFIIAECLLLLCCSVYCKHLSPDASFEMEQFASAFALSIITYTVGNKVVKGFKFNGPDEDKDGIPDAVQEEYYKWERQQRKDGVDEKFITLAYFLDEHEDLKSKIQS